METRTLLEKRTSQHTLSLNGMDIEDNRAYEIGVYLDKHPEIKKLSFANSTVGSQVLQSVAEHGKNLTTLYLAGAVIEPFAFSYLESLNQVITELDLNNLHPHDNPYLWSTLKTFSNLTDLNIRDLKIVNNKLKNERDALEAIASLKQLTTLRIGENNLMGRDLETGVSCIRFDLIKSMLTPLTNLYLLSMPDYQLKPEEIRELKFLTNLRSFSINAVTIEAVWAIAETFPNLKNAYGNLFKCTDEEMQKINRIEKERNIKLHFLRNDPSPIKNRQSLFYQPDIVNENVVKELPEEKQKKRSSYNP